MLDGVQEHMANASVLSTPVYANGELNKVLELIGEVMATTVFSPKKL